MIKESSENYGNVSQKSETISMRFEYLLNVRRLRLLEYLKGASIRPDWMIISLLPVLPPDLRPIISNPRGYITGDINIHYQNIVYRNNMIERLSNVFWIPKKLVSLKQIYSWQKMSLSYSPFLMKSFSMTTSLNDYLPLKDSSVLGSIKRAIKKQHLDDFNTTFLCSLKP